MKPTVPFALAGSLALFAMEACARQAPGRLPAPAPPPLTGDVSFRALAEPAPSLPKLAPDEEMLPPRLIGGHDPPAYPARPLAAGFGEAVVAVRIVIDAEGYVSDVADSPLMPSTPGSYAGDFRAAVEEAVRAWRFVPAVIRRLEKGRDFDGDGRSDYRKVIDSVDLPFYIDLRFDFRIVEGQGVVTTLDRPT